MVSSYSVTAVMQAVDCVAAAQLRAIMHRRGYAYIDGRDFDAKSPLTVMEVNLWDKIPRRCAVAKLRHGARVRVLDSAWFDDRTYVLVRRFFKKGWVPLVFLSAEKHETIGDKFWPGRG